MLKTCNVQDRGNRLCAARLFAGLTQAEVAQRTGLHQPDVSQDERSRTGEDGISLKRAMAYARFYGVGLSLLFPWVEANETESAATR